MIYKKLLTVKDVASMVGCSDKTIYSYVETGGTNIPYIKLGRGKRSPVRFDPEEIADWIESWNHQNHQTDAGIKRYNKNTETVAEPRKGDG